jgi:hypothetical protein
LGSLNFASRYWATTTTLDRVFGRGDFNVCVAAGRFSATWSMNAVLKVSCASSHRAR